MAPTITFHKRQEKLIVHVAPASPRQPPEIITMAAATGGWRYAGTTITAQGLPAGKWLITEDPRNRRDYFGLFYRDGKINDQFSHRGVWRNGIRFGFHQGSGSHGCLMAMPEIERDNASKELAAAQWRRIQELVRATPAWTIKYKNDSDPHRSDPNTYSLRAYLDMTVQEV